MPIDYSKFNNIEDSDEEAPAAQSITTSQSSSQPRQASSGREKLEGNLLDKKLQMLSPSSAFAPPTQNPKDAAAFADFAGELERWANPRAESEQEQQKPGEPKKVCVRSEGRKKIHTTYPDGAETVEEYDERTDVLLVRKSRRPTPLGGEAEWIWEVGQPVETQFDPHGDLMRASSSNPIFLRKDTPDQFQWRVRNLVYPADVYSVTVDHEKQEIVIRTSNKKYYKRFNVPDLVRLSIPLKDNILSWKHQHNTLIISYTKPDEVLKQEQKSLKEIERSAIKM